MHVKFAWGMDDLSHSRRGPRLRQENPVFWMLGRAVSSASLFLYNLYRRRNIQAQDSLNRLEQARRTCTDNATAGVADGKRNGGDDAHPTCRICLLGIEDVGENGVYAIA